LVFIVYWRKYSSIHWGI